MAKKVQIKVTENGPYLVSGGLPLKKEIIKTDVEGISANWEDGEKYPDKESYALCRCGHSKTMPYCSGQHQKIAFDGTETAGDEEYLKTPEVTAGPELILEDVIDLCASARFCDRAGQIWNLVEQQGKEAKEMAIQEAADCPAGRLVVHDKETGRAIEPKFEESISLVEDPQVGVSGPIWVKGGVPVESADGHQYQVRNRVTLCRCGQSKNKPFCDTSHIEIGFSDEE
jgi:CDGSH-type Zn-finger protein